MKALTGRYAEPRKARLAFVSDPSTGERIDQALVFWFPAPASETGEDVLELHLHGGRAVIAAVLKILGRMEGLRLAEPGEFTRRAFDNGHLDLTAVEGLADLIGAETEGQRRQALGLLGGRLAEKADRWRASLISALALIESGLDFSDEGDVSRETAAEALAIAARLKSEIDAALADAGRGERVRDGLVVAIAGPVNAGKSSLFNAVAGRDAAIVSPYPGTTRDVLELHLDLGGLPVVLLDTAGMRDAADPVEAEGVKRAAARAARADLVWWVEAPGAQAEPRLELGARPVWRIWNKADLGGPERTATGDLASHRISVRTGEGVSQLLDELAAFAATQLAGEPALVTRERQRLLLEAASAALGRAETAWTGGEELAAEELRAAATALGRLTGRIDVEDVLDALFREFCIGK